MDLANWTMGPSLYQVSGAYEQNGDIYVVLSNGDVVNLNTLNFRWLVVINSLSRAIETWEDSISSQNVSQVDLLSILGYGTTVGYFADTGVLKVTALCGE